MLGQGVQNAKLKKCVIFCTLLRNFVHLWNTLQLSAQSRRVKSIQCFVAPTFRWVIGLDPRCQPEGWRYNSCPPACSNA